MGETNGDRIATQERWDMTSPELQGLWLQSGDKECVSCKAVVPPKAMLPPGPANFYPGKCHKCAEAESRENSFRVTGRRTEGPPLIPMRDGTSITVAEFARRVRERQLGQNC